LTCSNKVACALALTLRVVLQLLSRDMQTKLNTLVRFLIDCRPLSVTMGNAIRYFSSCANVMPASAHKFFCRGFQLPEDEHLSAAAVLV
jgi:translation initiation factor 2B subunit (eIF-2B alpha/beta/delta family)